MMRLKLSLRNSAKSVLLFSLLIPFFFSGCSGQIEPTYKEEDIPYLVRKICKEEYNLDVVTQRAKGTLWIYAPLEKILHKDYGVDKEKVFDEEMAEKLRHILTTIGRVLISSDNPPEFYALVASDVNVGIDYLIMGNTLDIKKSYSGFIPWMEANRRYVIQLKMSPEAIGDRSGLHMEAYDIQLPEFLAAQIIQRVDAEFRKAGLKEYFELEKFDGMFKEGMFLFEYSLKQVARPPAEIDPKEEFLNVIAYCIKTYDYKDFTEVRLSDLMTQDKINLNRGAIWARSSLN
jgi:hypothetical protein